MSKRTIYRADIRTFGWLQDFFAGAVLTPSQQESLETTTKKSIFWNGKDPWNRAFVRGITAAQGRIHNILDATKGVTTKFHTSGLTKEELEEIAGHLGIRKTKIGKTKEAIWAQIKRKISPDISKEELRWIFAGLLGVLANDKNKDDVSWLKNNYSTWEDFDPANEGWIKKNSATITDLEMRIEDVVGMTVNRVITNHHSRLTKADLLAVEKKLGIVPPSSQLISRGVIKLRIVTHIQKDIQDILRRAGVAGVDNTIAQTWGIV